MKVVPVGSGEYLWVFEVVVHGFRIIGLAPFTLQIESCEMFEFSGRRTYKAAEYSFSKMGFCYNLLFLTVMLAIFIITFPRLFAASYANKSVITEVADVLQVPLCFFTGCIILIFWALRQNNAASIMNRLVKIDFMLSGLKTEPRSRKKTAIRFVVHVIVSAFIWTSFTITGTTVYSDLLSIWFCTEMSILIIYCFMIQYSVIVWLVSTELGTANEILSELNNFSDRPYDSDIPVLSSSTYSQLAALRLLRTIRTHVSDVSRDISGFYSFPMLTCIAFVFVTLVYNIYYLITPILVSKDDLVIVDFTVAIAVIFIGFHPVILLTTKITNLENEAELTGLIIHKLLATVSRPDIKAELEQFSHQLLHENISFTACGFFSLDCTLLHSMLAATATYLVILIQFLQYTKT